MSYVAFVRVYDTERRIKPEVQNVFRIVNADGTLATPPTAWVSPPRNPAFGGGSSSSSATVGA